MKRRAFLAQVGGATAVASLAPYALQQASTAPTPRFLRPPRALAEKEFSRRCVGCARCAQACQNNCIRMLGAEQGLAHLATPAIFPRSKGCTLCMACTRVCPTGALQPMPEGEEPSRETVQMGVARIQKGVCFSYNGRTCGACAKACPLQGRALKVGMFEQPEVNPAHCVGCGLCEQACLHLPQAIRVRDDERFA